MIAEAFRQIDAELARLEAQVGAEAVGLAEVLEPVIGLVARMMRAWIESERGRVAPAPEADVLDVWRALVKGDPSWNAIRDNCRELVFYRNCMAGGRQDALPPAPHRMAVRTARHVYLYVRTRALREGLVAE
jgi:hypothetical protein